MIFSKGNNMYELLGYDHMFGKHVAPLPHAILCMICHCVYGLVADESPLCFSMRRPHCIWCHQIYVFTQIAMRIIACFHFTPLAADNICHPIRIMPKRAAGCNVGFEKHLKRSCLLVVLAGALIFLFTCLIWATTMLVIPCVPVTTPSIPPSVVSVVWVVMDHYAVAGTWRYNMLCRHIPTGACTSSCVRIPRRSAGSCRSSRYPTGVCISSSWIKGGFRIPSRSAWSCSSSPTGRLLRRWVEEA